MDPEWIWLSTGVVMVVAIIMWIYYMKNGDKI